MLNVPNALTISRVLLIPVFVISLMDCHHEWALVVFVTAGFTDVADGFVARITHQRTELGAILDPIADKLLLASAFITLAILKTLPSWIAVLVITRDLIISLGFGILVLMDRRPEVRPTTLSRINTVVQGLTICMALYSMITFSYSGFAPVLIMAAAGTTILTGFQYIHIGTQMTSGSGLETRG